MHRLAGFAVLLLLGCLREKVQYCNNGAYCPEPLVCTERASEPYCGQPVEVTECLGKADEDPCLFGGDKKGYCDAGLCTECDPNYSFCGYDVWTAMNPVINGTRVSTDLMGVWAAGPTDVYAVGRLGTFVRWNGREWSAFPGVAADAQYEAIWGSDANNIYVLTLAAVDNTRVFRFDGTAWIPQKPGPMNAPNAVAGSASNVFVVGALGEVGRYNGAWSYTAQSMFSLFGVWVTDENNAVAVGNSGAAIRYASGTWSPDSTGTTHTLRDVAGAAGTEFAVGRAQVKAPVVVKHENNAWTNMAMPAIGGVELQGVWALSPSDAYAVGETGTILHYDGVSWSPMQSGTGAVLQEITATSTDVFTVGAAGTILRLSR